MKTLLSIALLISMNSFANDTTDYCSKAVKSFYLKNGSPSDRPLTISNATLLPAGKPLLDLNNNVLKSFDADKLVYTVNGSYHSGWFTDLIIANPNTCETELIINIYGE